MWRDDPLAQEIMRATQNSGKFDFPIMFNGKVFHLNSWSVNRDGRFDTVWVGDEPLAIDPMPDATETLRRSLGL